MRIVTLNNAGLTISIDLEDTELEGLGLAAVTRAESDTEWIQCVTAGVGNRSGITRGRCTPRG